MAASHGRAHPDANSDAQVTRACLALHEHAILPVAMLAGPDHRVDYVNPAFCKVLGRSKEALLGRPFRELLPEGDRSVIVLERVFRTGKPASHTERRRSKANPVFWAYSMWPVEVDGCTLGVMLQVSESAQLHTKAVAMNEALLLGSLRLHEISEAAYALNADLAASDEAKDQFLTMLSHELRSPLHVVLLWAQLLKRPETQADVRSRGLEIIMRSSRALSRLLEDLLDVHRIASGNVRLELAEFDLAELTTAVFDSLQPAADEIGVHLEREIDAVPLLVSGDAARLQQVLRVLLDNALRFTPSGGRIRVAVRRKAGRAEVQVIDTGLGISAAALPHIFERFRQEDPHSLIGKGGLGLGLAIAQQLALLHGASLSAKSPGKGKGATFLLSLPLQAAKGANARRSLLSKRAKKPEALSLSGARVLVVDADVASREALRLVLEHAAAETLLVDSTEKALEAFEQRPPQVVLAQIGILGHGIDLASRIRALPPERGGSVPLVAFSGHAGQKIRARVLDSGYQAYLIVPADPAEIVATLAALLRPGPPRSAARARKLK